MKRLILLFSYLILASNFIMAETIGVDTLKVAVKNTPPFIIEGDDGEYSGISIELWEEIARELEIAYVYEQYDLKGLLNALNTEAVDLSINPLSVTSQRVKQFNFTQPFYISNLCVAVSETEGNRLFNFIRNFFSVGFLKVVLLLLVVMLIFGFVFWLAERKKNNEDFRKGLRGVLDGLWFSAVTMTTVGYGDKAPKTAFGKSIALIWMFTAIIIISSFTAGIASALTVNKLENSIKKLSDLQKVKVGTLMKSTSAAYLNQKDIQYIGFNTVEEGLKSLNQGKIKAFVYDEPIVQYYIKKAELDIDILPFKFNAQYYSFSMPYSNDLAMKINPILLQFIESNQWIYIKNEFGVE